MKIEIWSDFVCPFCYIGKRLLEQALENFSHKDQVEIIFKSFELDQNVRNDQSISVHELLAKKYGMSVEKAKAMNAQVIKKAATVGLAFNFDQTKQTNTLNAHRLAKHAESKGKAAQLTERILKAHFTESQFIGSDEILIKLAVEVGLNQEEVKKVLTSNAYLENVRADEMEANQIGIRGVPYFVFNRKYAVSGAQPIEVFKNTLEKAWQEAAESEEEGQ